MQLGQGQSFIGSCFYYAIEDVLILNLIYWNITGLLKKSVLWTFIEIEKEEK